MTRIAFDTHAAASRFKRAGFTDDQVEALVEVTRATTALPDVSTLATKGDLEELETKVDARFTRMEARTDTRFAQVEAKIASSQVQTLTIMISATAFIVTLATVLSKIVP
jgi:hypothetical protein